MSNRIRNLVSTALKSTLPAPVLRQIYAMPWFEHRVGDKVIRGPFTGMTVLNDPQLICRHARLAGRYELELHDWIGQLITPPARFDAHVHVGAADGYYAVGLSRAWPGIPCIAFEQNPGQSELLLRNAELNSVAETLQVHGTATPENLEACVGPFDKPFVMMDVEGAEDFLLDPARIPSLKRATVILEIHHLVRPGLRDDLIARMQPTHTVDVCGSKRREMADLPLQAPFLLRTFRKEAVRLLLEECRGPFMEWALFRPK